MIANNSANCTFLKKCGYEYKKGEIIFVPIEKIGLGSHKNVEVKCHNCGNIKEVRYQAYNKTTKNGTEPYYCNNSECINKKRIISIKNKYGVKNVFQLEEIKEKITKTNISRYGVENPHQNKDIITKAEKTNILKYGTKNPFASEEIKNKIKKTNLLRYGVEYPQQSSEIRSKYLSTHKTSKSENDIYNYINYIYDGTIIRNSRSIITGYELDIYLPDLKLAFEFNGLYWHSELFKDKNCHKFKSDLCEEKGIQLIHIWEDDWIFNENKVKSIINDRLNNYEMTNDNFIIQEIFDNDIIDNFLNENHIKEIINGSVNIGLFYNDELISIMVFDDKIKNKYRLLRFCNKLNVNFTNNIKLLFNYFIKNYDFSTIELNIDRSYSNIDLYVDLGFKLKNKSEPNSYLVVNKKRISEDMIIKEKIVNIEKFYRIYDSGNLKFIYSRQ